MSKNELNLSEMTTDIAERLRAKVKDKENGFDPSKSKTSIGSDVYYETLPEGITKDVLKKVNDHKTAYAAAGVLVAGEQANAHGKDHKDFEEHTFRFGLHGRDHLDVVWKRETTTINPQTKEPMVKHGVVTAKIREHASNNGAGEIKQIRSYLSEQAEKFYKD